MNLVILVNFLKTQQNTYLILNDENVDQCENILYEGKWIDFRMNGYERKVKKDALNLYKKLNLRGITRSEFIFKKNIPYFLETNTIPGMTEKSIIPQQFKAANKNLKKIILAMINEGLK